MPTSWVAVHAQTSVVASLVASALPDGAEVVLPEGDFTSVVFPFLVHADRGVRVRQVPLAGLADAVRPSTTLVAFSMAQSSNGELADVEAVRGAAAAHGALTFCDLTQAAGWIPCRAGDFDVTSCSAYKWLCHPRGTAYLTARPEVWDRLRPLHAGWYAGESRWDAVYGPQMVLAHDARRFDVSPAWLGLGRGGPRDGPVRGRPPRRRRATTPGWPTPCWSDRPGTRRPVGTGGRVAARPGRAAGGALARRAALVVAGRAGRVRIGFHLLERPGGRGAGRRRADPRRGPVQGVPSGLTASGRTLSGWRRAKLPGWRTPCAPTA